MYNLLTRLYCKHLYTAIVLMEHRAKLNQGGNIKMNEEYLFTVIIEVGESGIPFTEIEEIEFNITNAHMSLTTTIKSTIDNNVVAINKIIEGVDINVHKYTLEGSRIIIDTVSRRDDVMNQVHELLRRFDSTHGIKFKLFDLKGTN